MFDWLVETLAEYPYAGAAIVFLACGLGLPLPEEIVLVSAGYACFKGFAHVGWMMLACAASILAGDTIPFLLGRLFGPRLLRLRPLRVVANRRRLAKLDLWFRRRGDLAVFFARFVPGLRVIAYFTAGTLRMPVARFALLDLAGIALVCPPLIWIGFHFGDVIDEAILRVQQVERGILWTVISALVVLGVVWSLRQHRKLRELARTPSETFVAPSVPPAPTDLGPQDDTTTTAQGEPAAGGDDDEFDHDVDETKPPPPLPEATRPERTPSEHPD